jgi:hypothetical protein
MPQRGAPPAEDQPATFEEARELLGVVLGVDRGLRQAATVTLRLDDGGTATFGAELPVAQHAARLLTRPVRAIVTFEVTGDQEAEGDLEHLEPRERDDEAAERPLPAFDEAREALREGGFAVKASDWLRELDGD